MYYNDRSDAGRLLAARLTKYKGVDGLVLAIPRGGVPVAFEVARALEWPMDVVLTKKIGHPQNKEYAIGAASLTDYFVIPHDEVSEDYVQSELQQVRHKLKLMQSRFRGERPEAILKDKTLIVVDDGIATGNTLIATIALLRRSQPKSLVIAVPVASEQAVSKLSPLADELIVLQVPDDFYGVGTYYENFSQVTDEEAVALLVEQYKAPSLS